MPRPNGWIVGSFALLLILAFTVRPQARMGTEVATSPVFVGPTVDLALGGCPSVTARRDYERTDCLQAVRLDLLEGEIGLVEAMERLDGCAAMRNDLRSLAQRSSLLRVERYRARAAFADVLDAVEQDELVRLSEELAIARTMPSAAAVSRLQGSGITPAGIAAGREESVLARLREDSELRAAFHEVFGDAHAADLQGLLEEEVGGRSAVVLGASTIIPNRPAIDPQGRVATSSVGSAGPVVVRTQAYTARIVGDLAGLESARLRFLGSAARYNQRTGSVGALFSSLRERAREDEQSMALRLQAERDQAIMLSRLANLERRLGIDPLLGRMAGESVGLVGEIQRGCRSVAENRQRWVRTGAGLVTGLVGAAGVVVATGATGTMLGGVTIAAAIEATAGAYLVARSERARAAAEVAARRELADSAADPEEERGFRRPEGFAELEDGNTGEGQGGFEEWLDEAGEAQEREGLAGGGVESDAGDATDPGARQNTIPPILPVDLPEELRELPPFLDNRQLQEAKDLTLPEIQERLDEFLAMNDPTLWSVAVSDEALQASSREDLIAEAKAALLQWAERRELSERFGSFFIQAQLETVAPQRRAEVLARAAGRYASDRSVFAGSGDLEELRRRFAARLVTHCRSGAGVGDLVLTACTDETALSILLVAALRDAGITAPVGSVIGVQALGSRFQAVVYQPVRNEVFSLTRGTMAEGVVGPIYHPAIFYYGYLVEQGVVPEIDTDRHLLIALPDRPMPAEMQEDECREEDGRSLVGRAVEWVGSMVGVRRVSREDPCGGGETQRTRSASRGDGGVNVDISMPSPPSPLSRGGSSGQSGGGQGGGGSAGAASPVAPPGSSADAGGSGDSGGEPGGAGGTGGDASSGTDDSQGQAGQDGSSADGGGADGETEGDGGGGGGQSAGSGDSPQDGQGQGGDSGGQDPGGASSGTGGTGGYGIGNTDVPAGPDLVRVARETVRMSQEYDRRGVLRLTPWRLRADDGMLSGASSGVLYADNERALERFRPDEPFLTLSPAEVETQRRMQEAGLHPIFPADTECGAANLPPRGVFRRAATAEGGFRYVYCTQTEAMVIFRERADAASYAALSAPDRPLYLARLASERLERFERSPQMARINALLADPNILRTYSREELHGMAQLASDLLVFQNALESALVQSMNELGSSGIRSYYYDMHRQVLQAPFFVRLTEQVYRLNQRLASDPLQSLAWANVQPELARQGFFELYHTLGGTMEWPMRWAILEQRYGARGVTPPTRDPAAASLDFLQILSDPTRVQVDWHAERAGRPSIRDRQMLEGAAHSPREMARPTASDQLELQEETDHQRGGTGGLGQTGDGTSRGPERGRQPLQMIYVRVAPDAGDPDRQRLPEDNSVRPGGTDGERRTQTDESASRQEPILWVSPQTFVDALLSTWDGRELKPATAGRVPPLLRFNRRLREVYLREFRSEGRYENRLRSAMEVFTAGEWLDYAEVRDAMGGDLVRVRAHDTGRFSAAYGGNPPINDQDQIRLPNFFAPAGVTLPADLFDPVRDHYTRAILGIFDLSREGRAPEPASLRSLSIPPGDSAERGRAMLLRSLEILRDQAEDW